MAVLRDDVLETRLTRRVQAAIRHAGLQQQDVAQSIGLTPNQVSDRFHGKTRWSVVELYAIGAMLGIHARDLLP